MATYKLTLKNLNNSGENSSVTLTYDAQGTAAKIKVDAKEVTCTLSEFNYSKEIYCPGKIWFRLQLGSTFDPSVIYKLFSSCTVQLSVGTFPVAENYRVFNIQLERKLKSSDVYVIVEAFSPDKFLTLDTYCKAYTGKKLVKEIIQNKEYWPDNVGSDLSQLVDVHPQFLEFAVTKTEETEDPNTHKKKTQQVTTRYEFIQPYLVQYNESFLDFLVRVTNRCGEFFYYEGGKIHIGWEATDPITIQEYVSVKFPQEIRTAWADYAIADIHNDYTQGKNIINFAAPIVMRDSELAFDENLAKIPPKGEYTSWQDFALFPGCYFVNNISGALNSATITEMMEFYVFKSMASLINSKVLSIDTNNSYEKSNFDSSKPYFDERKNGDDLHPFSTNDTNKSVNSMTAYCLDFYTNIRNGIESAERSRLQIELGDHYCEASLGSLIQFEGDTQQYIVVKIESQIDSQIDKLGLSGGETLSIEVIPYTKGQTVYPPSAHVESTRSAKAQRAIITHNQDPLKMNRVRVRYPWQGKTESVDDLKTSEDSTPWIRIALPMASDGSGFNFLPEVGDEAIINFENGNIEKPYVEGMLYSGGQTVPFSHKRNNARVLSSVNGHCIIFSDPGSSTNAIKSLSPLWSTISSFIPTAKFPFKDDDVRKAMGGIEFTDEYGLYSISMSSEKRTISVDSPFGRVGISAYTGITISAPNGNIRIEGKNITLAAGNNVTIESGINKKTDYWPFTIGSIKEQSIDLAESLIKKLMPIDMGLIRTVMETFLRPIGGTMLIKSNRYLRLEAGKGETKVLSRDLISKFSNLKSLSSTLSEEFSRATTIYSLQIYNLLNEAVAVNFIQAVFEEHKKAYIGLTGRENNYGQVRNNLPVGIRPKAESDWNTLYTKAKNNTKIESIKNNNPNPNPNPNQDPIKNYNTFVKEAKEYICNTLEDAVWKNKTKNLSPAIQKLVNENNIKILIKDCYNPVCYEQQGNQRPVVDGTTVIDPVNKRKAVFAILKRLIEDQRSNLYRKITLTGSPSSYEVDDWSSYFNNDDPLQIVAEQEKPLNKFRQFLNSEFMKFINKGAGTTGMFDQYVWDKTEDGKILFSDDAGTTLQFLNNTIQPYQASRDLDQIITDLKTLLRSI